MKNIYVLPTDKPSRLYSYKSIDLYLHPTIVDANYSNLNCKNQNIYITSDEEIKEGDWATDGKNVIKCYLDWWVDFCKNKNRSVKWKKIIITTSKNLIEDGVQDIEDEFLEWFVKNPSYEEVKVHLKGNLIEGYHTIPLGQIAPIYLKYQIIIPKEEPKQETLEEFAERLYPENWESIMDGQHDSNSYERTAFINGAKWQQQRSYSEEEVKEQLNLILAMKNSLLDTFTNDEGFITDKWFEQFKKK